MQEFPAELDKIFNAKHQHDALMARMNAKASCGIADAFGGPMSPVDAHVTYDAYPAHVEKVMRLETDAANMRNAVLSMRDEMQGAMARIAEQRAKCWKFLEDNERLKITLRAQQQASWATSAKPRQRYAETEQVPSAFPGSSAALQMGLGAPMQASTAPAQTLVSLRQAQRDRAETGNAWRAAPPRRLPNPRPVAEGGAGVAQEEEDLQAAIPTPRVDQEPPLYDVKLPCHNQNHDALDGPAEGLDGASFAAALATLRGACTLVVRNVPARNSQEDLLKNSWRPDGSFDLFHLPFSAKLQRTVGYVFINFVSAECAARFFERWQGRFLQKRGSSAKRLDIRVARLQGFERNLRYISHSTLVNTASAQNCRYHPAVFRGTTRLNFLDVLAKLNLSSKGLIHQNGGAHEQKEHLHQERRQQRQRWQNQPSDNDEDNWADNDHFHHVPEFSCMSL